MPKQGVVHVDVKGSERLARRFVDARGYLIMTADQAETKEDSRHSLHAWLTFFPRHDDSST